MKAPVAELERRQSSGAETSASVTSNATETTPSLRTTAGDTVGTPTSEGAVASPLSEATHCPSAARHVNPDGQSEDVTHETFAPAGTSSEGLHPASKEERSAASCTWSRVGSIAPATLAHG